LTNLLFHMKKH